MNARDANKQGHNTRPEERHQDNQSEGRPQGYRAGGDQSARAARSGAAGERNPEGSANRPEPKNQDEKGMGTPRNR